jgi:hypothetical protein
MKICYVDESGCTGMLPSPTSEIQPAFIVAAIMLDYGRLHRVTESFLQLKQRFFPKQFPASRRRFLAGILSEIKGSDLRRSVAHGGRNKRRHAFGFLDGLFQILEDNQVTVLGRAWIKGIALPIDGVAIYTFSIQSICAGFQEYLRQTNDLGVVTLDSRWHQLNQQVAHSIFTQKFRMSGDALDRIVDLPTFAHSDNHAGLQIADMLASALLFPMAANAYCAGIVTSVHVQPQYSLIRDRYGSRLRSLQFRYNEASMRRLGGIVVSDSLRHRSGARLFS